MSYPWVVWDIRPTSLEMHISSSTCGKRRFMRHLGCHVRFRSCPCRRVINGLLPAESGMQKKVGAGLLSSSGSLTIIRPYLLEKTSFRPPTNTRQKRLFELPHTGSNYFQHNPLQRLLWLGNDVCSSVAFFAEGLKAVKCAGPGLPVMEWSAQYNDIFTWNCTYSMAAHNQKGYCVKRFGTVQNSLFLEHMTKLYFLHII